MPQSFIILFTTWRTSARHQRPFGFIVSHWQPPSFFSAMIFSIINDLRCSLTSFSRSASEYPKQKQICLSILWPYQCFLGLIKSTRYIAHNMSRCWVPGMVVPVQLFYIGNLLSYLRGSVKINGN